MMLPRRFWPLCLLATVAFVAGTQAQTSSGGNSGGSVSPANPCQGVTLSVNATPQTLSLKTQNTDTVVPLQVTLTQPSAIAGVCYLTISGGLYGNVNARTLQSETTPSSPQSLRYTLTNPEHNNSPILDQTTAQNASDVVVVTFDGTQPTYIAPILWTIPGQQNLFLGNYSDTVTFDLHQGASPSAAAPSLVSQSVKWDVTVPSEIFATLSQPGQTPTVFVPQSAVVDFGDLSSPTTKEQTLDLSLLGTNGYRVTMVSDHAGKMVLNNPPATVSSSTALHVLPTSVAYQLRAEKVSGGSMMDIPLDNNVLSNAVTLDQSAGSFVGATFSPNVPEVVKLHFSLNNVPENLHAGDYADHITVTVESGQ